MKKQEAMSSSFKGDVFALLRKLVADSPSDEILTGVADLLKTTNAGRQDSRREILNAVSNNLSFLSESLSPSKALSEKLSALSHEFRSPDAAEHFIALKDETLTVLREVQSSILFSKSSTESAQSPFITSRALPADRRRRAGAGETQFGIGQRNRRCPSGCL
jgi:hypothetical protein